MRKVKNQKQKRAKIDLLNLFMRLKQLFFVLFLRVVVVVVIVDLVIYIKKKKVQSILKRRNFPKKINIYHESINR